LTSRSASATRILTDFGASQTGKDRDRGGGDQKGSGGEPNALALQRNPALIEPAKRWGLR
jgi:hypothetical protein